MAAAAQPGSFSERLEELLQRTGANIECSRELVRASRRHWETACNLIQENAELREFLRENVLNDWSRREHRFDVGQIPLP